MLIKDECIKPRWLHRLFKWSRFKLILLIVILYHAAIGFVYKDRLMLEVNKMKNSAFVQNTLFQMRQFQEPIEVPKMVIDIKFKDYQKLEFKRHQALERKVLFTSSEDYVPAKIEFQGKKTKVRLRLKGDWTDHLANHQWSFRVNVKGENTIFGMKKFSLQHPYTRNYLYEWLFQQALKREGILGLRYEYLNVVVNGKNLGIYALEEAWDKRLLENQKRREGVIVKFNSEFFWRDVERSIALNISSYYTWRREQIDPNSIDSFSTNKVNQSPVLSKQFTSAKNLLTQWRSGALPTEKVFDIDLLAKYLALCHVFGARHATENWFNWRFYYNPVTSLLEPIGFDGDAGTPIKKGVMFNSLFMRYGNKSGNHTFEHAYLKALEKYSQPSYLNNLLTEVDSDYQKNVKLLSLSFPDIKIEKGILTQNQKIIHYDLNPSNCFKAYVKNISSRQLHTELVSHQKIPVSIYALFKGEQEISRLKTPHHLYPNPSLKGETLVFNLPENIVSQGNVEQNLSLHYKILGSQTIRKETIIPHAYLDDNFSKHDFMRREANHQKFPRIKTDKELNTITLPEGTWNLNESLILPAGYVIHAKPGLKVILNRGARILSYSPLLWQGSEDKPIIVTTSDGTGQGLLVVKTKQTSLLQRVSFESLTNPEEGLWSLTGAVTFYEAPVSIKQCMFIKNKSEDGLNIIRSKFDIESSYFAETFSDAFDGDFVQGEIRDSVFKQCGNDGIDVSGSKVIVNRVNIDEAGDKGISVGENSELSGQQIHIQKANIGVASKDLSKVTIENLTIHDTKTGLSAYQKKSEFGSATMRIDSGIMKNVTREAEVEKGSKVSYNGKEIKAEANN